jgi:menaquinone-specific isochorismate synthase
MPMHSCTAPEPPPFFQEPLRDLGEVEDYSAALLLLQTLQQPASQGAQTLCLRLKKVPSMHDFLGGAPLGTTRFRFAASMGLGLAWQMDSEKADDVPTFSRRLWHSLRFNSKQTPAKEWASFGSCRSWLPRLELDASQLLFHADTVGWAFLENLMKHRRRAGSIGAKGAAQPESLRHLLTPSKADFLKQCTELLRSLKSHEDEGDARKVVPVLRCTVEGLPPLHTRVLGILDRLEAASGQGCAFLIDWGRACFLGNSPERLYKRDGRELQSMALAGTRPVTDHDPAQASEDLLGDPKDRREHACVVEWLSEVLAPFCERLEWNDEPQVLELKTLLHLLTPVRAKLSQPVTDASLLASLHPTPAVLGRPVSFARQWISKNEAFDRGLFAGLVGLSSEASSEWVVAIRSILVEKSRVQIYAGAGLVTGSKPLDEWNEIQAKLRVPLHLLQEEFLREGTVSPIDSPASKGERKK